MLALQAHLLRRMVDVPEHAVHGVVGHVRIAILLSEQEGVQLRPIIGALLLPYAQLLAQEFDVLYARHAGSQCLHPPRGIKYYIPSTPLSKK